MSDKLRAAAQAALEWLRDERLDTWTYMDRQFYKDCSKHTKALEAALAEPAIKESLTVAEPHDYEGYFDKDFILQKEKYGKRPWSELTDDEINAIEFPESGTATMRDFVRIIEAKLRERNT